MTALILVLAANTAFNGFPVLGSILSQDRYLPRQLHTRGDRLAFSNGIVFLAGVAVVLVIGVPGRGHPADPALHRRRVRLVHAEPDRHGPALAPACWPPRPTPASGGGCAASQAINGFGAVMTGVVLVVVLVTKFVLGAWIAIAAMAGFFMLMLAIRRHYDHVAEELDAARVDTVLPVAQPRDRAGRRLHLPTLRALAYARATRPDVLEAVTVNVDDADTRSWCASGSARDPGAAQGRRVAVPGDHQAGAGLRQAGAHEEPARRGDGVHPGVRRRALVGAGPAQPERAAASRPACCSSRA